MVPRLPLRGFCFPAFSVVAPVNVIEYLDKIRLYLDARKVSAMHQGGGRLDFVYAPCGGRQDTALGPWKKCWLVFDRNGAFFNGSGEVQPDKPYVGCQKEREYVAQLLTIDGVMQGVCGLTNQVDVYTVLDRSYDVLRFFKIWVAGVTIATSNVIYEQRVVPCSPFAQRRDVCGSLV